MSVPKIHMCMELYIHSTCGRVLAAKIQKLNFCNKVILKHSGLNKVEGFFLNILYNILEVGG